MFRLLLKVRSVSIRIKEEADVQICIKKNQCGYMLPMKVKLYNGVAQFNAHTEFFINADDPIFEINVMMVFGSMRKFAGMCTINLDDWEENANNNTSSFLQKSPDKSASIEFDFMFMSTDLPVNKKELVSVQQIEYQKKSNMVKQFNEINQGLSQQNQRLLNELRSLKKTNQGLELDKEKMNQKFAQNQSFYSEQLKKISEEKEISNGDLQKMRGKIEKMYKAVEECGQKNLKVKFEQMMKEEE